MKTKRMSGRATVMTLLIPALFALASVLVPGPGNQPLAQTAPPEASHDIYNPARTALVNAQRQLAESARLEQEILYRVEQLHRGLEASVTLLASAGQLDPSVKPRIDALRNRLDTVQDITNLRPADSANSNDVYKQILDELQILIEDY